MAERSVALICDDRLAVPRVDVPVAEPELEEIVGEINELKRQSWEIAYPGLDPVSDLQR